MTVMLMAYLVVAAGVALWFAFPPERAYGTDPLQVLAPVALWPLPALCLVAFALVCWACSEERRGLDGLSARLDA